MGKRLTVILGAGASYDCISTGLPRIDEEYRPPLTSGIFEGRTPFQTILEKYPKARTLASIIGVRVKSGEALEAVLSDLRHSEEQYIIQQFRQIPLYLQELLGEISIKYTSEPENYTHLVNRLLGSEFERVAFVTLNYDLFLEKSLGTITSNSGIQWMPERMSFYVEPDRKWMLIKLHGSVNWGRVIKRESSPHWTHERMLDRVNALALSLEGSLAQEITVLRSHEQHWLEHVGMNLCYPAISVPVEDKYEFVCPPDQVDALRSFLCSCRNFLMIGISGRDKDLIDLLKENITECAAVGIVEANAKAANEVAPRFYNLVPQFGKAKEKKIYEEGFSGFATVRGRSLDDFLAVLK
jgi:hypothetical protein